MEGPQLVRVKCPLCDGERTRPDRVVEGFTIERCRSCRFAFVNPQVPPEGMTALYSTRDSARLIDLYARLAATPSVRLECEQKLDFLDSLLPSRGRLLDFACASGFFFERAQQRGWDAHGVDLGAWAKEAAEARGLRNMHVGDIRELGFPDGYFNVVYAAQVLEHLPRPRVELRELRRILSTDGFLYVDVPNYRTLATMAGRDDFSLNTPPQHVNYFTPRTLRAMLDASGFRDISITTEGGLKWENLVGRGTTSEIRDVYSGGSVGVSGSATVRPRRGVVKQALLASIVRPVFYRGLKVGMTIVATARR